MNRNPAAGWIAGLSGLVTAAAVAVWMRPPMTGLPFAKAAVLAGVWAIATVLAGTLGMCVAESVAQGRPLGPSARNGVGAAAVWVLIPPILLCWQRGSGWAVGLGACAGVAMAICVRGMILKENAGAQEMLEPMEPGPHFSDLPAPDSGRPQALAVAVCAELAVVLWSRQELFWATVLMGIASCVFVWKRLWSLRVSPDEGMARPAGRAAMATMLAMLILIPLLLRFGRGHGGMVETAQAASRSRADAEKENGNKGDANDAYRGIVLFTVTNKDKELAPVPLRRDLLHTGMARRLIIPFDGAYWYFQAPRMGPGLHPHLAHGDPVAASIFSTGWIPLAMQAHQTLAQPVELGCCGEMQVTVRNGDNRRGRIDVGVLLTDSTVAGRPTMDLGIKPIVSTEPQNFSIKVNPVHEDLTFAIPAGRGIRKFDEITVFFFPDEQRSTLGARVGIEQFELMPKGSD
jgi:hypothetical protein